MLIFWMVPEVLNRLVSYKHGDCMSRSLSPEKTVVFMFYSWLAGRGGGGGGGDGELDGKENRNSECEAFTFS